LSATRAASSALPRPSTPTRAPARWTCWSSAARSPAWALAC